MSEAFPTQCSTCGTWIASDGCTRCPTPEPEPARLMSTEERAAAANERADRQKVARGMRWANPKKARRFDS